MKNLIGNAISAARNTQESISFSVESSMKLAKDKAIDTADGMVGSISSAYCSVIGTAQILVNAGIIITAVVAPVPLAVGIGLMWLIELQINATYRSARQDADDASEKRSLERITSIMKKHGQIPQVATLKTSSITMSINSNDGTVCGSILKGSLEGRALDSLSLDDIAMLINEFRDEDTKKILEAYLSLRKRQSNDD